MNSKINANAMKNENNKCKLIANNIYFLPNDAPLDSGATVGWHRRDWGRQGPKAESLRLFQGSLGGTDSKQTTGTERNDAK